MTTAHPMGLPMTTRTRLSQGRCSSGTAGPACVAVAVLGFILWPLPHPYALALALSVWPQGTDGHARRQARVAAVISLLALVVFLVLLLSLLSAASAEWLADPP